MKLGVGIYNALQDTKEMEEKRIRERIDKFKEEKMKGLGSSAQQSAPILPSTNLLDSFLSAPTAPTTVPAPATNMLDSFLSAPTVPAPAPSTNMLDSFLGAPTAPAPAPAPATNMLDSFLSAPAAPAPTPATNMLDSFLGAPVVPAPAPSTNLLDSFLTAPTPTPSSLPAPQTTSNTNNLLDSFLTLSGPTSTNNDLLSSFLQSPPSVPTSSSSQLVSPSMPLSQNEVYTDQVISSNTIITKESDLQQLDLFSTKQLEDIAEHSIHSILSLIS